MKRILVGTLAASALLVLSLAGNVAAATVAAGTGSATYVGCPVADTDKSAIVGRSTDGVVWTFVVWDANPYPNQACIFTTAPITVTGTWNPAVGGCIAFNFCLTNPVSNGVTTDYTLFIGAPFFVAGTATLAVA